MFEVYSTSNRFWDGFFSYSDNDSDDDHDDNYDNDDDDYYYFVIIGTILFLRIKICLHFYFQFLRFNKGKYLAIDVEKFRYLDQ